MDGVDHSMTFEFYDHRKQDDCKIKFISVFMPR